MERVVFWTGYLITTCRRILASCSRRRYENIVTKGEIAGRRNYIWKLHDITKGRYDSLVFKELGFEDSLKEKTENISVNWNSLLIKGSKESIKRVVKEFEDGIITSEIEINDMPGIQRLFFNDDHGPNDRITAYIQSGISRNNISKYYYHCWNDKSSDSTLKGILYCRSKDDALTIKSIIEKGFCSFTLADYSKDVKLLIDEWKNKRELVETDDAVKGVIITCTQDVRSKIEKEHNKDIRKDFPVSAVIAKFLGKRQALLSEVGNSFGIDIYFDSDQSKLSMYGPYPAIKQALDEIKSKQVKDTMSIPAQPSSTLSREFDRIADEHQCGWDVKVKGPETEVKSLESCEYIATWYDPRQPGKLTVIEGETHNLNVDCLIILCTDSLFPLQITPDEEMHRVITDHISSACKPNIGGKFMFEVKDTNYKHVVSLVVGLSNASDKFTNKRFHGLASQFKAIFSDIESKALKTVCLPAYIEEGFLSTDIIVDAYLEAVIAYKKERKSLQFYLYCDRRKLTAQSLLKSIQKRYKKEVGFSRKIHQHGVWEMKDLEKTGKPEIEVEIGSIEHMKVDIIVNTTSTNLDFRRGIVSKRLLELAGEEILRECQEKYPRGINYSTIAVTGPWELRQTNNRISYVFHGAIPKFTRETFVQNVQSFVRSCLAEADERECKSIAFPALGTGSRGYPGRETAKAMFDAVTTYGDETLNPYVKRVVFSLYEGDIDICKVFQGEASRRNVMNAVEKTKSSLKPWTENKTNVQLLKGIISRSSHPVEVIIGVRSAIDPLQSNVVEIKLISSEEANIQWKYRDENPQTNNDQLIVSDGQMDNTSFMSLRSLTSFKKPEDSFNRAVVNAINYCVDNKIAEIAFDVNNASRDLTDDIKVKVIATQLERILSERKQYGIVTVFHTAYVRLMDTNQFDVVKKSIGIAETLTQGLKLKAHQFLNTVGPWESKMTWKVIDNLSEDKLVEVQIIGESAEAVHIVKRQMEDAAKKTFCLGKHNRIDGNSEGTSVDDFSNGYNGARPKTRKSGASTDTAERDVYDKEEMDSAEDWYLYVESDEELEETQLVQSISAEINPGFIDFKEKYHDLDRWVKLVEKTYDIRVEKRKANSNVYTVSGNYRQILDVKHYLDKRFPLDPKPFKKRRKGQHSTEGTEKVNRMTHENSEEGHKNLYEFSGNKDKSNRGKEENFECHERFPLDPKPFKKRGKGQNSTEGTEKMNRMTHENSEEGHKNSYEFSGNKDKRIRDQEENLECDHGYFSKSDESFFLPGKELESLLFMSTLAKKEQVKRMSYNSEKEGIDIVYCGNKAGSIKLKKYHEKFMRDVTRIEIQVEGMDEISKADSAIQGESQKDNIHCIFIPQDDLIVTVGTNEQSARNSQMRILKYLGRNLTETEVHSASKQNVGDSEAETQVHSDSKQKIGDGLSSTMKAEQSSAMSTATKRQSDVLTVKIYPSKFDDISADSLVVPYYRDWAHTVLLASGSVTEGELKQSIMTYGCLTAGECRVTEPGNLMTYKQLIHMCLDGNKNDFRQNLLQDAVKNSLMRANKELNRIVVILLTGLTESFTDRHADQYFDALKSFMREEKHCYVKEVHLIHHDNDPIWKASDTFKKRATKESYVELQGEDFVFVTPETKNLRSSVHWS